ncbi:hypothetical protein RRG08_058459 [Elysia crispata]|uniref:Uncharacterized protein n=1 Tax=Elysia crispata TaxID=231223 RepID=A0AAE0Y708_9GAST|nr:hypothetical protein RRG08_058459 [Elysia crispata]
MDGSSLALCWPVVTHKAGQASLKQRSDQLKGPESVAVSRDTNRSCPGNVHLFQSLRTSEKRKSAKKIEQRHSPSKFFSVVVRG